MTFDTDGLKNNERTINLHGVRFNKCEHCGYEGLATYRHYAGLVLCDRCTDKTLYGDKYWDDEDAIKNGYKKFNYPAPEIIKENMEEIKNRGSHENT